MIEMALTNHCLRKRTAPDLLARVGNTAHWYDIRTRQLTALAAVVLGTVAGTLIPLDTSRQWQQDVAAGRRVGPRWSDLQSLSEQ